MIKTVNTIDELKLPSDILRERLPWFFPSEALASSEDFPSILLGVYYLRAMQNHHKLHKRFVQSQVRDGSIAELAKRATDQWPIEGITRREQLALEKGLIRGKRNEDEDWRVYSLEWLEYAKALSGIAGLEHAKTKVSVSTLYSWFETLFGVDPQDFAWWVCDHLHNADGNLYTYDTARRATRPPSDSSVQSVSDIDPETKALLDNLWKQSH